MNMPVSMESSTTTKATAENCSGVELENPDPDSQELASTGDCLSIPCILVIRVHCIAVLTGLPSNLALTVQIRGNGLFNVTLSD